VARSASEDVHKLRREVAAIALITAAALTLASLLYRSQGGLSEGGGYLPALIAGALNLSFGVGSYAVPLVLLAVGVLFALEKPHAASPRALAGAGLMFMVILTAASMHIPEEARFDSEWVALYGGYVAPNVLKWHWWRFNGHGYFAGMLVGVVTAVAIRVPEIINNLGNFETKLLEFDERYAFFVTAPASLIASVVVCLMTKPESDEVLCKFYRDVRPWGFWGPVLEKVRAESPELLPNRSFWWDVLNVTIGIIWQLQLMVAPICLVIREWTTMWISLAVLTVTSIIMKFTWYDRLGPGEMYADDAEGS